MTSLVNCGSESLNMASSFDVEYLDVERLARRCLDVK